MIIAGVLAAAIVVVAPAGPAAADDFTNPATITIPALGTATPYPSPITVSGMTGTVTDVNVRLNSMSHAIAQDVDLMLSGPAGQNIVLMSDAANAGGFSVNGTVTFDDAAAGTIPNSGVVGTNSYRPTNNAPADTFPAPAPAPSTAATLAVFNGTNPNGIWNLWVLDDLDGDAGTISGGWTLSVTTAVVAQPGVLQFAQPSYRGAEGGAAVPITIERIGGDDGAVSVRLTTVAGTATSGSDFTAIDQVVTFADGQTSASVPLTIVNDTAVEGIDETLTVQLSDPTGGATLGNPTASVVTVDDDDATSDVTSITIPGAGTGGSTGAPAAPYPASIHVTGQATAIGGVEVLLDGFSHQVPLDVDILLVGPGGQNVVLLSDAGGQNPVTGLDLTFSDAGATTVPAAGPMTSGTFRATDDDTSGVTDVFPAPAPAPSAATDLSAFAGTDPNGVWSLFIVDDASGDVGSISSGWSLRFIPQVIADAGGPYTAGEGSPLTLDATGTAAGPTATYAWDLDDDGAFDDATGANPTVTAAALATLGLGDGPAGPVDVAVQVTEGPVVDTDATTLTITNVAPTVAIGTVPTGVAGIPVTIPFSATDPSAADTAAGFTYAITWGDGTAPQTVTGGTSVDVAHTYATAGSFTISVTATDKDAGVSAADTSSAIVGPAVTADAGGPYTIDEGSDLVLDATGTSAGPTATFAWDLDGDGAFDDATGANPTIGAAGLATLGLADGPAGPIDIGVQVTESTTVATDTTTVAVVNVAPTAAIGTLPTVVAGTPATFSFSAADPADADEAAGFTYLIDWGDGTPPQTVTGGTSVDVPHIYAADGTFTVSVSATDKDGGVSAAVTASVTVFPAVVADAGGPYTIAEGSGLVLDASGTVAGPTATYAWDLDDDGAFDDAVGPTPTISAATLATLGLADGPAGPADIAVQVTEGPAVDTDSTTIAVINVAPTATVENVPTVTEGTPATFDFAATDPSAADTAAGFTYTIDWGDGTPFQTVTGGTSISVAHTYATDGTFFVGVSATDKDGATGAADTATVTVDPAVTADAGGPYSIDEGSDLTLDGTAAGPTATFAWDLDDDGAFDDATGPTPTVTAATLAWDLDDGFADGPTGPADITVQVTEGVTVATDTTTVTVDNVEPTVTIGAVPTVAEGTPATFAFTATDPAAADTAAGFTYTVDWGDGTAAQTVTGGASVTVDHTYAADGTFTVTATATDKDGGTSAPDTATVAVTNVAPTVAVTVPAVAEGIAADFTFTATDPSADDTAAGFTYVIDWGDGTPVETLAGGASLTVAHTYATDGTFTLTVTAADQDGGVSAPVTATVTVTPTVIADAGGPYAIDEGEDLVLDASGSSAGPTATYAWDLDDDGAFDDATGPTPTIAPEDLPAPVADGLATPAPVPIAVEVSEGPSVDTDDSTVTVTNLAPVATIDIPGPVVAGVEITVKVGAIDPSPIDMADLFTYEVDWEGDGIIDLTVDGPADPPVSHTYPSPGDVGLTVIATDKDGASSAPTVSQVTVGPGTPDTGGGGTGGGGTGVTGPARAAAGASRSPARAPRARSPSRRCWSRPARCSSRAADSAGGASSRAHGRRRRLGRCRGHCPASATAPRLMSAGPALRRALHGVLGQDGGSRGRSSRAVGQAQLGEDVRDVVLRGLAADEQAGRDLRVRQALTHQCEDLALAPGERPAGPAPAA